MGNEQTIPNKVETRIDPSVTKETTTEGHAGLSVDTTVHITYKDGRTKTDSFNSTYDPVTTYVVKPAKETAKDGKDGAKESDKKETPTNNDKTESAKSE